MRRSTVRHRLRHALFTVLTVLVPLACSSGQSSTTSQVGTPTQLGSSTTASPGDQPSTSASEVPPTPGSTPDTFFADIEPGPGNGTFDTTAGLSDLTSYLATLTVTFAGTNAGTPHNWSTTSAMAVTKEPAARQLSITRTGDVPDASAVFRAELGGADFDKHGDGPCTADVLGADEETAPLADMAASLPAVFGADAAGNETVNGTPTDHYTFDERAILQAGQTESTGDVWVATTGGYVVKYLLTSKAGAEFFGDGIDGTVTWDYELTTANQPVNMTLPADCPSGMIDAPQLPDAAHVENLPGVLEYDTATTVADIVAFYQSELGARGWTAADEPTIDDTGALVEFTQGTFTLVLTVTLADAVATVQLVAIA